MKSTVQSAGSQFSAMRPTTVSMAAGTGAGRGVSVSSSSNQAASSPVVETMWSLSPGQAFFGSMRSMISSGSAISVAAQPRPLRATWK